MRGTSGCHFSSLGPDLTILSITLDQLKTLLMIFCIQKEVTTTLAQEQDCSDFNSEV